MRGIGITRRALCALVAVACCLVLAPAALATSGPVRWTAPRLVDHSAPFSSPTRVLGVACPTATTCLGVGDDGTVGTVTGSAPHAPTVVSGVDGGASLQAIACPSASLCVIQEPARLLVSTDPTAPHPMWTRVAAPLTHEDQFAGVTCASATLCLAWSDSTTVDVSTDPSGGASAWQAQLVAPTSAADEVESAVCAPGSTLCIASLPGRQGALFATAGDPAAGASSWSVTSGAPDSDALSAISCASATLCAGIEGANLSTSADPAAGAASWSSGGVATVTGTALVGIACPAATQCVTALSNGSVATSTDPAAGAASYAVSPVLDPAGFGSANNADQLACPSTGTCQVPDQSAGLADVTIGPPASATVQTGFGGTTAIAGLDCPSATLCLGVDAGGGILHTSAPSGPASGWRRTVQPAASHGTGADTATSAQFGLNAIDCPSVHFCVAGGANDVLETTTHPATATQWTETTLPFKIEGGDGETYVDDLDAISCPSAKLCVIGNGEYGILASTDPTGGASAWHLDPVGAFDADHFGAVSCPTTKLCVAGDDFGRIAVSTQPGARRAHWKIATIAKGVGSLAPIILSVSCPSASFCLAGDSKGAAHWSTDPGGGPKAWHKVSLATGRLINISCRSRQLCVAINARNQAYSTTDATGGKSAWHAATLPTGHFPIADPGSENLTGLACAPKHVCVAASGVGAVFPGATAR